MSLRVRLALGVAVVALAVVAGLAWMSGAQPAPAATFVLLDGSKKTTDDLRGKVTLVNFWATSCTTCVAEMPMLEEVLADLDVVCVMSVNPGFGGQRFIERTYAKVTALKTLHAKTGSKALIEIDGGVGAENAKKLLATGADVLVAGNSVFGSPDPMAAVAMLASILRRRRSIAAFSEFVDSVLHPGE